MKLQKKKYDLAVFEALMQFKKLEISHSHSIFLKLNKSLNMIIK